jgi:hypothetical protein
VPRHITAALGFRAHTGWAAVVAVAKDCEILDRRRIAYEPSTTRFVYHNAADMPPDKAAASIELAGAETGKAAELEIHSLIAALAQKKIVVRTACVPAGNSKLPEMLADILAAHSRIHAAEGVFYREALVAACRSLGIRVKRAPERDLRTLAANALGSTVEDVQKRFQSMAKYLGPPWGEDQKLATLAACFALG